MDRGLELYSRSVLYAPLPLMRGTETAPYYPVTVSKVGEEMGKAVLDRFGKILKLAERTPLTKPVVLFDGYVMSYEGPQNRRVMLDFSDEFSLNIARGIITGVSGLLAREDYYGVIDHLFGYLKDKNASEKGPIITFHNHEGEMSYPKSALYDSIR